MNDVGATTAALLREVESEGVRELGVIMRHSARTYIAGIGHGRLILQRRGLLGTSGPQCATRKGFTAYWQEVSAERAFLT